VVFSTRPLRPAPAATNTALGNIKTSLSGTFHAFGFRKYAHRYQGHVQYLSTVGSICARFSNGWYGRPLRRCLAHFAQFVRLNQLADQEGG
jgi:hypothetical protein